LGRKRAKGEGSVYRRKDGRWVASVTVGYNEDGSLKRKEKYAKTEKEAIEILKSIRGMENNPDNLTFGDWLDIWLKDFVEGSVSRGTYERYESNIRLHLKPTLGKKKLDKIKAFHLQNLYNQKVRSLSPRSVRYIHTTARAALEKAVQNDILIKNPAKATNPPKSESKEVKCYTAEEVKAFLSLAKKRSRYYTAFLLAATTGLRRGEILGLRWQDMDFKKETLKVNQNLSQTTRGLEFGPLKSKLSHRTLTIPRAVIKALKEHQKEQLQEKMKNRPIYKKNDLVFAGEDGSPVNPNSLTNRFKQIAKELEEKGYPRITLHSLRHSYASLALEAGTPVKTVQENLGHHSPAFTLSIYAHASDNSKRESAEKINGIFFNS